MLLVTFPICSPIAAALLRWVCFAAADSQPARLFWERYAQVQSVPTVYPSTHAPFLYSFGKPFLSVTPKIASPIAIGPTPVSKLRPPFPPWANNGPLCLHPPPFVANALSLSRAAKPTQLPCFTSRQGPFAHLMFPPPLHEERCMWARGTNPGKAVFHCPRRAGACLPTRGRGGNAVECSWKKWRTGCKRRGGQREGVR